MSLLLSHNVATFTPNRNCGVKKKSPYNKLLLFLLTLLFSVTSFPEFHWASMYHISLCFSCVALFGPRVRGWNKADPHFEADRVSKAWTWGQPSELRPDRGRVQQRCSLLRVSKGEKKRDTTARVIWCSFDPLSPLRWKGFQFLPRRTTSAQNTSFKAQQKF